MLNSKFVMGMSAVASIAFGGCQLPNSKLPFTAVSTERNVASQVPQLRSSIPSETSNMTYYTESSPLLDSDDSGISADQIRAMSLQDCIGQALGASRIMRDLGVSVVRTPQTITSTLDPALVFTDPRNGEEAALSAFDANFFASSIYERNDRGLNNQFFGVNGAFNQNLSTSQIGINKRSVTGGQYGLRQVSIYDKNNQLSNRFKPFSWDEYIEASVRQPLLQGAGTEFNRIAGPGATAGQLNGVLLARVRTDVNLVDFERSVRDFVADVENAYWDLYYAFRDLDARVQVREIAEETLRRQSTSDTSSGKIAQAQEQVDRFQSEIVDSLNGRPIDGTRTNNGSVGGTFRGIGGVRVSERKLRLLIGLPINEGALIQPSDSPAVGKVVFDWNSSIQEALSQREELRRQRWIIKQRELELIGNRNFLKPQLDMVSQYRTRGFGQEWTAPTGQYQEWQLGLEYQMPIGFRRANAAVRNSQLALVRESEILREQERAVHYGLSKRLDSIVFQLNAIDAKNADGEKAELDVRLETHRRLLDARLRYHQAEVEYMLALRNVHVERGTLLRYCNVWLNESNPSSEAMLDSVQRIATQDYAKIPESRDVIVGSSR
jgi:hypothetical protein